MAGQPLDATFRGLGVTVPRQALLDSLRPGDAGDTLVFPMPGLDRMPTVSQGPLPRPLPPRPTQPAPGSAEETSEETADATSRVLDAERTVGVGQPTAAPLLSGRAAATTHGPGRFPLRVTRPPSVRESAAAAQRRRSPDLVGLLPRVFALFAWFLVGVAGTFYDRAHPSTYGLDMLFGVRRSLSVVAGDLVVARALLMVTVLLCVTGLAVNSLRMKRAGDRYNRSLIFLGIASLLVLAFDVFAP